jgi:phosphatidate cytidylyltransferase
LVENAGVGVIAATVIFVLSVTGDLAGSLIKRSLAIKDSGSLLPGIGGIFDLIDSLAFTMPVAYLYHVLTVGF